MKWYNRIVMSLYMLVLYVISIAIGIAAFLLAFKMWRNYPERYLTYLFFYVVLFILGNFLSRTLSEIVPTLLGLSPGQEEKFFAFQGLFLLRPLVFISFYVLILFVMGMLDRKPSRTFTRFYFGFWGVHWITMLIGVLHYLKTGEAPMISRIAVHLADPLNIFILLYSGVYLAYRSKDIKDRGKRKAARGFGILWFAGVIGFNVLGMLNPGRAVVLALGFATILPALIFLYVHLNTYYREHPALPGEEVKLRQLFSKYDISEREQEVIGLVSRGKSNKEISDELYISLQTVKHHIHGIYRKLNIRNRVQLSNFIRNSIRN